MLIECHRVEVAAVDLSDFRAQISERLNETRFVFRDTSSRLLVSCLFVQGASPCINSTIFRQTHRVIISTGDGFCAHWKSYLRELSQMDDSIGRDAKFAVQVGATDEHFATLGHYG